MCAAGSLVEVAMFNQTENREITIFALFMHPGFP